jgi:thioredoxin 1
MELKIIDLYASWCQPCKTLAPILEAVTQELNIELVKIDIEENDELAEYYKVRSIPTLIFMKEGVEVGRHIGMIQKDKLIEKLKGL